MSTEPNEASHENEPNEASHENEPNEASHENEPGGATPHGHDDVADSVAATAPGIGHAIGRFDAEVDRIFTAVRGNRVVDRAYYSASALGDWSLIWHLLGAAQGMADPTNGWRRAARLAVSLGVESALVNGLIKRGFRRTRPVHDGERPHNLRMPSTSSFPSGHASSAFMAAHLLADRSRLAPAWYLLAAVVATSRIHVRIHHASDVVGGAALGLALGALVRRLVPLDPD
jgi:undecaprenyl-diphosphatase